MDEHCILHNDTPVAAVIFDYLLYHDGDYVGNDAQSCGLWVVACLCCRWHHKNTKKNITNSSNL